MSGRLVSFAAGIIALAAAVSSAPALAGAAQDPRPAAAPGAPADRALLDRYCVTCHNQKLKTAGLALDQLDVSRVETAPESWEKVVRKLRAGLMPPAGVRRPDQSQLDAFTVSLEQALDRSVAVRPNPGRTESFHRLNRVEYQNAVRDLLGVEIDVTSLLPGDDASYGFDNIAGVLKLSPTLLERYLTAAQKVSRIAVGTAPPYLSVETIKMLEDAPQDERVDGLPFGTRGGTSIRYTFPMDGEYLVEVRLSRLASTGSGEDVARFPESHDLEIILDGERLRAFTLAGEPPPAAGKPAGQASASRRDVDADWAVRVPVKAGPRQLDVTFPKKSSAVVETVRLPFLRPQLVNDTRYQPYLGSVTISGPFAATGPGDTPSRRRIFVCRPDPARPPNTGEELRCARTILSTLARRAYRRPVTDADLDMLLRFYAEGRQEQGFDLGIQRALELVLTSPEFLFRIEEDPRGLAPGTVYRISELELASRLSFFLWSSIPDDELLDLAVKGKLRQPGILAAQVRRMLDDERSKALVHNFAGQWLYLRNVPGTAPDPSRFPDFDETLRQAFVQETELLFASVLREGRGVLELLTADYTFINERLARHYGIPNVKGSDFRRVAVSDERRRGLLGQGSVLTVTAYPHRTSPVLRGKWVLENLLGAPPPPPPPNVPDLKDTNARGVVLTMRERMAQHRANAVCASCHSMMDPPGLSLENYDAVGRLRTVDETFKPVDASGVLPDGTKFEGVNGLREALLARSGQVVTTFTEKLLTYALGRGLEYYDAPAVRSIVHEAASRGYPIDAIILNIVNSVPFQMRRSQS